jgi:PST family polysaccharide transporter
MIASQGATQVLALITSVVVARFLAPRRVGLAAEAVVFVELALVAVDFGFATVIVQRPALSEEDKSTAFWAGMALGVGMTVLGVGLSWPIAALYHEHLVQSLLAVMSLTFLFTAPGIVQGALLTRELRFRSLELRTIAATTASCIMAMALAALGAGPWAIVAQVLTISFVSTALLWRSSSWRPRLIFSLPSLRGMARYTSHVFGSRTLLWANENMDNFLVGRFLGAASLGAYSLAFSIAIAPVKRLASPVSHVFFPAFSRMRNLESIREAWLRAVCMLALVLVPPVFGVIVVAPDFVRVVFGPKWHAAAPALQLLAPVGLLLSLMEFNDGILKALAQTHLLFRMSAAISILSVCAFASGLNWGIRGVATAYLLVSLVIQPTYLWLTARAVGISPWAWLRSIAGVVQAGAMMVALLLVARALLVQAEVSAAGRLACLVALGPISYCALVLWRAPEVKPELRSLLARIRHRDGAARAEGTEATA